MSPGTEIVFVVGRKKKKRMNLTALESQAREAFVRMKTAELGFHPGC